MCINRVFMPIPESSGGSRGGAWGVSIFLKKKILNGTPC